MTGPTLGERFLAERTHHLVVDGRDVYGLVRLRFARPATITVRADLTRTDVRQGLVLEAAPRQLRVGGSQATSVVLWSDAPFPVDATLVARKPPFEVSLWNVWQGANDATTAWVGNGGLTVRRSSDRHVTVDVNCGPTPLTFGDGRISVTWPADAEVTLVLPD